MDDLLAIVLPYIGGSVGSFDLILTYTARGEQLYGCELTASANASRLLSTVTLTFEPRQSVDVPRWPLYFANSSAGLFFITNNSLYRIAATNGRLREWRLTTIGVKGLVVMNDELYIPFASAIESWGSVHSPEQSQLWFESEFTSQHAAWQDRLVRVTAHDPFFQVVCTDVRAGSGGGGVSRFAIRPNEWPKDGWFRYAIVGDELFLVTQQCGMLRAAMRQPMRKARSDKVPVVVSSFLASPPYLTPSTIRAVVRSATRVVVLAGGGDGTKASLLFANSIPRSDSEPLGGAIFDPSTNEWTQIVPSEPFFAGGLLTAVCD